MKSGFLPIMALCMGAVCASSLAHGTASMGFIFDVPLRCSVDTVSGAIDGSEVALVIHERCNSGRGYALHLDHARGQVLAIRYDGRDIDVSQSGRTLLERSRVARNHRAHIEIDMHDDIEAVTAMLVITPNS